MAEEEPLYVGIEDQTGVRKQLLFSSRKVITALQKYEKLKDLQRQQVEETFEFRKIIEEIAVLNRKLKNELPKTRMRAPPKAKPKAAPKSAAKKKVKTLKPRPKSKLDVLEEELGKIESKLSRLEG